jgi:hypothetical protein
MHQLGFNIVNTLSWERHIDRLVPKLNTACYTIRTLKPYLSQETLLMVCYAYFHSVLNFGIIFWGNSFYAISIFRVQKRVLRITTGTGNRNSCRQLFKTLRILPLHSQYIYSLLCFVVNNIDSYQFITDVHNRNTRRGYNLKLYQPSACLTLYQKGTYYMGIRVFNSLHLYIKKLYNNCICFKLALKDFCASIHSTPWMNFFIIIIRIIFSRSDLLLLVFYFCFFVCNVMISLIF